MRTFSLTRSLLTKKQQKLERLKDDIRVTKANLRLLQKAKKDCTCDALERPHYHVLIHYDRESGDEYLEASAPKHRNFIDKLGGDLVTLEKRLKKLGG